MGFLQKLGLVEEVVPENDESYMGYVTVDIDEQIDVNVEEITNENLISDIYNANALNDFTKSIFKVEELINSLPKEMVTDTKRASVLAILSSFGLTPETVTSDGSHRAEILKAALDEILESNNTKISTNLALVEDHKKQIAALEKEISELENTNKLTKDKITVETDRIATLVAFIEGGKA